MKTLTISVKDEDYSKLKHELEKLTFVEVLDFETTEVDIVSHISEESLAEDWLSEEDNRYDELSDK